MKTDRHRHIFYRYMGRIVVFVAPILVVLSLTPNIQ
jgi:hypothetical protein